MSLDRLKKYWNRPRLGYSLTYFFGVDFSCKQSFYERQQVVDRDLHPFWTKSGCRKVFKYFSQLVTNEPGHFSVSLRNRKSFPNLPSKTMLSLFPPCLSMSINFAVNSIIQTYCDKDSMSFVTFIRERKHTFLIFRKKSFGQFFVLRWQIGVIYVVRFEMPMKWPSSKKINVLIPIQNLFENLTM